MVADRRATFRNGLAGIALAAAYALVSVPANAVRRAPPAPAGNRVERHRWVAKAGALRCVFVTEQRRVDSLADAFWGVPDWDVPRLATVWVVTQASITVGKQAVDMPVAAFDGLASLNNVWAVRRGVEYWIVMDGGDAAIGYGCKLTLRRYRGEWYVFRRKTWSGEDVDWYELVQFHTVPYRI